MWQVFKRARADSYKREDEEPCFRPLSDEMYIEMRWGRGVLGIQNSLCSGLEVEGVRLRLRAKASVSKAEWARGRAQ